MVGIVRSLPCDFLNTKWLNWLEGKSIKFPCFALFTFCALKCNGDIVPCLSLWDEKIGNVKEQEPLSFWHSPEAKKARGVVKRCQGCLNSWGMGWSVNSSIFHAILFFLRQPRLLFKRFKTAIIKK
jgi:MoaA/NifB/PqqE/SkfB family radical SAM enzyme